MTYAVSSVTTHQRPRVNTVDIAGTAWPVYKIEALILGALVFVGTLTLSASMQVAVLAAAAATVVGWWTLMLVERRSLGRS